ncbi:MAG: hypothetical protein FWE62_05840 [Firmicutes bacterium]|nr:hypothetical protein [Bacillota bacterium]
MRKLELCLLSLILLFSAVSCDFGSKPELTKLPTPEITGIRENTVSWNSVPNITSWATGST